MQFPYPPGHCVTCRRAQSDRIAYRPKDQEAAPTAQMHVRLCVCVCPIAHNVDEDEGLTLRPESPEKPSQREQRPF